jgi:hypothetical protein
MADHIYPPITPPDQPGSHRKRLLWGFVITVTALTHAATARADRELVAPYFVTKQLLVASCLAGPNRNPGFCSAYILGVTDTFNLERSYNNVSPCPAIPVTSDQVVNTVIAALAANPQYGFLAAADTVMMAVAEAWHCQAPR